jgi:hypothetical protein
LANLRSQESIRGVLDHLGCAQIGDHDRGAQRQVQLGNFLGRFGIQRTQYGPVRLHKIPDCGPFAQKLRAGDYGEGDGFRLAAGNDLCNPVAGADGHRGLVDNNHRRAHIFGDAARGGRHVPEVGFSIDAGGRAYCNKSKFGAGQRLGVGGCECEPAGAHVPCNQFFQPRFVDRHFAAFQACDPFLADIQGDHAIAQV